MLHEITFYWIGCDFDGCLETTDDIEEFSDNKKELIERAKSEGWFVDEDQQIFLCPEHKSYAVDSTFKNGT